MAPAACAAAPPAHPSRAQGLARAARARIRRRAGQARACSLRRDASSASRKCWISERNASARRRALVIACAYAAISGAPGCVYPRSPYRLIACARRTGWGRVG